MAFEIINEVHEGIYNGVHYREHERYVSGEHSSASVYDDHILLDLCGLPELTLTCDRAEDLRDVLNAALDLCYENV